MKKAQEITEANRKIVYYCKKMKKDFQKWHTKKEQVDAVGGRLFFHEREIWWCLLGVNIGSEQDGRGVNFTRSVLIFKKFNS